MKHIKFIISLLVLIGIFYSCDEDSFTTIRELKLPEHEKKLAVFSKIYGSNCEIFVSHSKSSDDTSNYKLIKANIILRKNNKEFFSFVYPDDMIVGGFISPTIQLPQSVNKGEKYTLEVISDELGTAKASQTVPRIPVITDISYKEKFYIEKYDTLDQLEFKIVDPGNEENFYFFNFRPTTYTIKKYHLYLSTQTDDPIIKSTYRDTENGFIISDKTFDGEKRNITMKLGYYLNSPSTGENVSFDTILINIKGLSKDYYNFLISKIQYDQSGENPFAEPVNIYSNIENGYGLFSIENPELKVLKLK